MIRKATVDYTTFFRLYQWSFDQYRTRFYRETQYHFPASFIADIAHYSQVAISDAILVVIIAMIFTKLRLTLTRKYFLVISVYCSVIEYFFTIIYHTCNISMYVFFGFSQSRSGCKPLEM